MKRENQILLLFAVYFSLISKLCGQAEFSRNQNGVSLVDEVHVGVILDMGSREGKTIHSCVSMAISDFYSLHTDYEVRIVLHTRDSKGNPLLALSAGKLFLYFCFPAILTFSFLSWFIITNCQWDHIIYIYYDKFHI